MAEASAFDLYQRISPVTLTIEQSGRLLVHTFTNATELLKQLHYAGRNRIPLRKLTSECGTLSHASLGALNCYLALYYGKKSLDSIRAGELHRFTWHEIQQTTALRWIRDQEPSLDS
jgi:hypothetical protein